MSLEQITRLLELGRATAEAGDWETARRCFARVLRLDPCNEDALLWQAALTSDPRESVAYLKQVQRQNPNSRRARSALAWAEKRLPRAPEPTAAPSETRVGRRISLLPLVSLVALLACLAFMALQAFNNVDTLFRLGLGVHF